MPPSLLRAKNCLLIAPFSAAERYDPLKNSRGSGARRVNAGYKPTQDNAIDAYLNDPTLNDAILNRVVQRSTKIDLPGVTVRDQKRSNFTVSLIDV